MTQHGDRCRWCRAPLPERAGTGRPRVYCRQACRQRDYITRLRSREAGLAESELVLTRRELDALYDLLYVLECAIDDVDNDLPQARTKDDYREALTWLLDAARPVVQFRTEGIRPEAQTFRH